MTCHTLCQDVDALEKESTALKSGMEEVVHAMMDPQELPVTVELVNRLNLFVNAGSNTDGQGLERWLELKGFWGNSQGPSCVGTREVDLGSRLLARVGEPGGSSNWFADVRTDHGRHEGRGSNVEHRFAKMEERR